MVKNYEPTDHWAFKLAYKVKEREKPYIITAGATLSGPLHVGTVCEFLFPWAIKKALHLLGEKADFYFIVDDRDAFDSIPKPLFEYKEMLQQHLGKPLHNVPDPFGCHDSYSSHYESELRNVMSLFSVDAEVVNAHKMYDEGKFLPFVLKLLEREEDVKKIIEETSGRSLPKNYSLLMPICDNCGKIATTTVISFDLKEGVFEYVCDKDVGYTKGCGYRGRGYFTKGSYKLQWRAHWVVWQRYFSTTIEGGGVDHFTKGGSWDTAREIHSKIFGSEPPIGYKYGFILRKGKKYSKSKGEGMTLKEILSLIPPKVVAYHLLKYHLEENIDLDLDSRKALSLISDYEFASNIEKEKEDMTNAEKKKYFSYVLAGERTWEAPFRDVLLLYRIYADWNKVSSLLKEDFDYLKPFVERWVEKGFIPEEYDVSYKPRKAEGIVREFFERLNDKWSDVDVHNFVYEFAKEKGIEPKQLFKELYKVLVGKDRGPKLGRLIYLLGIGKVKRDVL